MLNFKAFIISMVFIAYVPETFSTPNDLESKVLKVVDEMNSAWLEQDLSRCILYFSADTDFENSYGWSISSRQSLKVFLQDFLFAKYPKIDQKYVHTSATVEFLTADLAIVEEAKRIDPQSDKYKARFVRTNFLLKQVKGEWLIWKTRSWTPKFHHDPPKAFVTANKFPDIL